MHTEIEIKGVEGRAFLLYYYEGIRQREYNGNKLSLPIYPNKAKTQADKVKLLKKLKFEFEKALEKGWNPLEAVAIVDAPVTLEQSIQKIVDSKITGTYSRTYTRDIEGTAKQFLEFLTQQEKSSSPESLSTSRITAFLDLYNSSNRNYMNKRQYLNVILPGTISRTVKKKYAEKLHEVYTKEQMLPILKFLKLHYPRLHLVALLGTETVIIFLRPEIPLQPFYTISLFNIANLALNFNFRGIFEMHAENGHNYNLCTSSDIHRWYRRDLAVCGANTRF